VTLLEYGDYECPYCSHAEPTINALLAARGDVRYVWRHLPLTDVHPDAQAAAESAEAAAAQGAFWEMHDRMYESRGALGRDDLIGYAGELGLDAERVASELDSEAHRPRVQRDLDSGLASGVTGTPGFFVGGRLHHGSFDAASLITALEASARP